MAVAEAVTAVAAVAAVKGAMAAAEAARAGAVKTGHSLFFKKGLKAW
jgi:hypothetical protein